MIRFDLMRTSQGRRGLPGRGGPAALALLLPALMIGCVTPGVQGIQSDLDSIQKQLFRVQQENAEMAEKLAALRDAPPEMAAAPDGASAPEINLRLEAIERDLAALALRNDQTDQRLAALVQDLRSTREALHSILLAPAAAADGTTATGQAVPPAGDAGVEPSSGPTPQAAGTVTAPGVAAAAGSEAAFAMEDLFEQGYSDYQKENYALALVEFEQFAERYPASEKADDALYYMGEVHYAQEQYFEAVEAFDQVVEDYPGGEKAGPAYLKKGLALLELNRTADAVIQLQHVISAYPQSEEARIARDRLEGLGLSAR